MNIHRIPLWAVGILMGMLILGYARHAHGSVIVFYDEASFLSYAGDYTLESFETIPIDNWINKTRLGPAIPAYDAADEPHDLDSHFTITAKSIAWAAPEELFTVTDAPTPTDGAHHLRFGPYFNALAPAVETVSFDNFNDTDANVNAFGLNFVSWTQSSSSQYLKLTRLNGMLDSADVITVTSGQQHGSTFFFGVISSSPFVDVGFLTNQNGGSIGIDEIYYSSNAIIPIPGAIWLFAFGLAAASMVARRQSG